MTPKTQSAADADRQPTSGDAVPGAGVEPQSASRLHDPCSSTERRTSVAIGRSPSKKTGRGSASDLCFTIVELAPGIQRRTRLKTEGWKRKRAVEVRVRDFLPVSFHCTGATPVAALHHNQKREFSLISVQSLSSSGPKGPFKFPAGAGDQLLRGSRRHASVPATRTQARTLRRKCPYELAVVGCYAEAMDPSSARQRTAIRQRSILARRSSSRRPLALRGGCGRRTPGYDGRLGPGVARAGASRLPQPPPASRFPAGVLVRGHLRFHVHCRRARLESGAVFREQPGRRDDGEQLADGPDLHGGGDRHSADARDGALPANRALPRAG